MISSAAQRWPERELIFIQGQRYTYSDINRWVIAAAHALKARGVVPGDRVLLHLGNCIEILVLQLAVWRLGAVSVPVVPIYRQHEMRHILADSRPRLVVAMKSFGDRSPAAEFDIIFAELGWIPESRIVIGSDTVIPGWELPVPRPASEARITDHGLPQPASSDQVSLILYTSGTTSAPKGAKLTGRALLSNADNWRATLRLSSRDVAFGGAPLAHIAALCSAILAPMRVGARAVIMSSWNADLAADLIVQESATFMAGATVFLQDLVERFEGGTRPLPSLMFLSGGAATPPALVERADKVGIAAVRCWGMTETAGTCTLAPKDTPLHHRSQFDGHIVFGTEVKIVDDEGRPVPPGNPGHVWVRSPQLMVGYTDPVVTAEQMDSEGWFNTGDVGLVTEDGWFSMHGRTKDIINRGGEKFSSRDIEAALLSCPGISSAAVVGVPHPRLGEDVAACVVMRQGASWEGPEAVLDHLRRLQLAKQKMPTRWIVLERLPMTATGKVQKQQLVKLFDEAQPAVPQGASA